MTDLLARRLVPVLAGVLWAGIVSGLILSACSPERIEIPHSFDVQTVDGVIHALSSGNPKYSEPLFEYEPVVTLLEDDENEESLLYRPRNMRMDKNGFIYVEDYGNMRIAVFSPDGVYHHSFGREGDGPGEFRYPQIMSIGDSLISVFDLRLNRTSVFDADGVFLRLRSHATSISGFVSELFEGPRGTLVILGEPPLDIRTYSPNSDYYLAVRATVLSAEGDTLCILDTPRVLYGRQFLLEEYRIGSTAQAYFKGRPVIRYCPGKGLLRSTGEEPFLQWYDLSGKLTHEIRIDMEREEVAPEERSAIVQSVKRSMEESEEERFREIAKRRLELMKIPDTKDFWTTVLVDDSEFIWLQKMLDYTKSGEERSTEFFVLSPEGEFLGETVLPARYGTLSHGYFLAFETDSETGATTGVVYGIKPAVPGLEYP